MTNVDVYGRVRSGKVDVEHFDQKDVVVIDEGKQSHSFNLKQCWEQDVDNKFIFNTLLDACHGQERVYWLAFGYTGSGKTYTINAMISLLLNHYNEETAQVSCYQIYNDKLFDMLNKNKKLVHRKTESLVIQGLVTKEYNNDSVNKLFKTIKKARTSASTTMNQASSRSHLIMRVEIADRIFTLADLAGQEVGKTSMKNDVVTCREASQINLSLLALKECIRACTNNLKHVPFRRSLLTMALKPMFVTRTYSAVICTLYPKFLHQTIDTLKYGSLLQAPNRIEPKKNTEFQDYKNYLVENVDILEQEKKLLVKAQQDQILPKAAIKKLLNDKMQLLRNIQRRIDLGGAVSMKKTSRKPKARKKGKKSRRVSPKQESKSAKSNNKVVAQNLKAVPTRPTRPAPVRPPRPAAANVKSRSDKYFYPEIPEEVPTNAKSQSAAEQRYNELLGALEEQLVTPNVSPLLKKKKRKSKK
jgi:hypothetical protein